MTTFKITPKIINEDWEDLREEESEHSWQNITATLSRNKVIEEAEAHIAKVEKAQKKAEAIIAKAEKELEEYEAFKRFWNECTPTREG